MNFLPIVGRELRVASRKRSTFWLRVSAALAGLLIGTGCLVLGAVPGLGTPRMGSVLFNVLTWLCLGAGLCAGLFFTADCLSEEKREGTLGFLFLTDLRGYDVVLGKLLATSLRGFYALLALLPILAMTQLMGGITGAQYWKSSLALINGLLISLAAGMLVSALSRDSQKALAATLFVLLLLSVGGPILDWITGLVSKRGFRPLWSLSSPAYVLLNAGAWGRSPFWRALLTTHVACWVMFVLACIVVPHTWQQRRSRDSETRQNWAYAWKYGGRRRRTNLQRKLLDRQPITWLSCRERWQSVGIWVMAVVLCSGFVAVLSTKLPMAVWMAWNFVGGLFSLVLYIWAASQACRFFVEARRSGLIELLLAAPIIEKEIVDGQWRGLLRMFGFPVLLLLIVQVAGTAFSQIGIQGIAAQANAAIASGAITNQSSMVTNNRVTVTIGSNATPFSMSSQVNNSQAVTLAVVTAASAGLSMAGNLLALCWFGMWMGMTSKSASLATLKNLFFVQVIPWFVISFASTFAIGIIMSRSLFLGAQAQPTSWMIWWPLMSAVLSMILSLAKDIGFIIWSRKKLYSSFRAQAVQGAGQPRISARPPLPIAIPAPPVIATHQ